MAKINKELIARLQNTEKTELIALNIDGEAFEFTLQKKFTPALQQKAIEYIQKVVPQFKDEKEVEEANHLFMIAAMIHVFTDIEMPVDKAELIDYMQNLMFAGIVEKIVETFNKKSASAIEHFTSFIINLAKVIEDGSIYETGKKENLTTSPGSI